MRRAQRHGGGEVIDRLRDDARPVDRIDAGQAHAVAEGVVIEHRLHQRLAIVEGAFDRERVHVFIRRRGHHAPLHLGNAAVREQHHHVDLGAAAERLDRGAAGVARSCDHDGGALAALTQHVVHQPRHQLHGEVLEGERRPVKQFEHEQARPELGERRGRRMAERAVGLARHAGEIGLRRCRRRRRGGSPRPRPRRKACRQNRRSFATSSAGPRFRAHKGRRRGPAPRASPRQNRVPGPRPALRYNALNKLYFLSRPGAVTAAH